MIKDAIIVIPFHVPWIWHADYPTQTALVLKKHNTVVCFLWREALSLKECLLQQKLPKIITKPSVNLYFYTPLHFLPFRRFRLVQIVNLVLNILLLKGWLWRREKKFGPKKKILWLFGLFDSSFFILPSKFFPKYLILYDCVDYAWHPDKKARKQIQLQERKLLQFAHIVIVHSLALYRLYQRDRADIHYVPIGFNGYVYTRKQIKRVILLPAIRPIIGFIGAIGYRLDFALLTQLAARNPQWLFALVGPIETEGYDEMLKNKVQKLIHEENVMRFFIKKKQNLPGVIKQFDIGMIPYDVSLPFNKYCNPLKLYEYFYMGKPVIATPIAELRQFSDYVKLGKTVSEWEHHIKTLLSQPWPKAKQQRIIALAHSWEKRIAIISEIIVENKYVSAPSEALLPQDGRKANK
ncbi:MAG: hypothetical protein ACOY0S_01310 [Patescibacteria group bacterium]